MPHSPRTHAGRDWLLESGTGSLCAADFARGTRTEVTRLPGFTRGLDFSGPYAFIGLSQVRETATFSGIPLLETGGERACGIWVVDTRTGQTAAWLRFDGSVREIFAVQVLHDIQWPDLINLPGPEIASSFILPDEAMSDVAVREA